MQSVFQSRYFGIGYGCGSLLGGLASHAFGYQKLFTGSAGVVACGWALVMLGRWRWGAAPKLGIRE